MKNYVAGLTGICSIVGASHGALAQETITLRMAGFLPPSHYMVTEGSQVFMDEVARSPETQTYLGMIEDTEAYGRWDDRSDSAQIENYERGQRQTEEMQARFDREALTDAGHTAVPVVRRDAADGILRGAIQELALGQAAMGIIVVEVEKLLREVFRRLAGGGLGLHRASSLFAATLADPKHGRHHAY